MKNKLYAYIIIFLFVLEIILCFVSWIVSAVYNDLGIRSVISDDGIRWFWGHYSEFLATPILSWILLLSFACGTIKCSGVLQLFKKGRCCNFRERVAFYFIMFIALIYIIAIFFISMVPHAILLSATGDFYPSPFFSSLVPMVSFGLCLISVVYGGLSGNLNSVQDVCKSLFIGVGKWAPVLVLYVLLIQLYYTLCYVLNWNPSYRVW